MTAEIPDTLQAHYKAKARNITAAKPNPVSDLIHKLDDAVIDALHHGGSTDAIDTAFEAVLTHPESTWTREVLQYRLRQLHYS
jgi:hypothetical protein